MLSAGPSCQHARRASCLAQRQSSFLPSLRDLQSGPRHTQHQQRSSYHYCTAGLGIGYLPESSTPEPQLIIPKPVYGLSVREMAALGITPEAAVLEEEEAMVCRSYHYLLSNIRMFLVCCKSCLILCMSALLSASALSCMGLI